MWQRILIVLGRIFLGYIFVVSGISKIFNWHETQDQVVATLSDWSAYATGIDWLEGLLNIMSSMPTILLVTALALELIGGVSVLIGFRPKWGAIFLVLFLIPTTLLYHHFWFLEGTAREEELIAFMKNCAILGGLLVLWAASNMQARLKEL